MSVLHTNVADYLFEGKTADTIALSASSRHTYGDLQSASKDVARYLLQSGAHKGDRVIVAAENSFFWVAAYLGVLRAGLICVPVPTVQSPKDLADIVQQTEARLCFCEAGFALTNADSLSELQLVADRELTVSNAMSFSEMRALVRDSDVAFPDVTPGDLAALMFTSGSTGRPRGVMISHANIMANTDSIIEYLEVTNSDSIFAVLPFHYCFGTSLLHTHLRVGGTLVLHSRFLFPDRMLDEMQQTRCTGFAGVPSHYQILLRRSTLAKRSFPHLRYLQQAGGHLAPCFVRELRAAFPLSKIFVMYGQTEATARLSYLPPHLLDSKLGSIGKGIPGVKLRVIDSSGRDVQQGELGEIVATGENIALGYWRDPEASAQTFRNGSLYTGDIATVDRDGFIYVVDRAKDFLKCGGKRVSCRTIEEQLLEYEEVLEAAVVGFADDILGEAAKAFIVPRRKSSSIEHELRFFCRERMPLELVPKVFVVVDSLPKNGAGKVLKEALRTVSAPGTLPDTTHRHYGGGCE